MLRQLSIVAILGFSSVTSSCGREEVPSESLEFSVWDRSSEGFHLAGDRFADISADPRRHVLNEAYDQGLVRGYPDATFRPDETLTREQFAVIVSAALGQFALQAPLIDQQSTFHDVLPDRWSFEAVERLARLGLVSGRGGGAFVPEDPILRSEASLVISGIIRRARARFGKSGELPEVTPRRTYTDMAHDPRGELVRELSGYCYADTGIQRAAAEFAGYEPASRSFGVGSLMQALSCFKTGAPIADSEPADRFDRGAVLELCETDDPVRRSAAIEHLREFPFASLPLRPTDLASSQEACVLSLLPAAMYVNLSTGVPAGTLIGQAIQETGWCRSKLAREGLNFHGQKAKFSPSLFPSWNGESIKISSTESPTGEGRHQVSAFMKFDHPDQSFKAVTERFLIPWLPYRECMELRDVPEAFMQCIGKTWAVHVGYADVVLAHRQNWRSASRPGLRLSRCELAPEEWELEAPYQF